MPRLSHGFLFPFSPFLPSSLGVRSKGVIAHDGLVHEARGHLIGGAYGKLRRGHYRMYGALMPMLSPVGLAFR